MKKVTEQDLRMPEFRDASPDDLEFRDDGKLVRKDRWEVGFRNIVSALGGPRDEFEIPDIVEKVRALTALPEGFFFKDGIVEHFANGMVELRIGMQEIFHPVVRPRDPSHPRNQELRVKLTQQDAVELAALLGGSDYRKGMENWKKTAEQKDAVFATVLGLIEGGLAEQRTTMLDSSGEPYLRAMGGWDALNKLLAEIKSGVPVVSAYQPMEFAPRNCTILAIVGDSSEPILVKWSNVAWKDTNDVIFTSDELTGWMNIPKP